MAAPAPSSAMSSTIGNTKDLNASRTEGLLSFLGHTNGDPSSGATLSMEELRKLSDKINGILGDGADRGLALGGQPSQLLNEDGLPIVDILESLNEDPQRSTSHTLSLEQDLTPFSLLPLDERGQRRRERERILDLLEEEERLQHLKEEQDAEEERKEAIRKRKESARAELAQLRVAQELQKKMGQALVRHAKEAGENRREGNARSMPQTTFSTTKKCVSFADTLALEANEKDRQTSPIQPDWGDVTLGRLRAQSRIPMVSTAEAQKYPMKMRVVERRPTGTPFDNDADSDDESVSSAEHLSSRIENDSSGEEDGSSSNDDLSNESLEEGFDYDTAQHHREIALEYYKKRHAIGAETARALAAQTFDDCEQHENLQSNGQAALSHFRADRMTAAYDNPRGVSTSIGGAVVPTSCQKSLRNSVKLGKLENDQLVGGYSEESGSEDETIRKVTQMLQTNSIQNTGPNFTPTSTSTTTPSRRSDAVEFPPVAMSTAVHGAKPSKFKLARGGGIAETTTFQDNKSGENDRLHPAISSVVERKTPRSLSSPHFPINKPPPRSSVKNS